jgi:cyclopropane fatty-acyl-phospholipid synthase-like methyltransferase
MTHQENEYWVRFWSEYQTDVANKDEQSQVLRTRNKQPIDQRKWEITLETVGQQLELQSDDTLLDLCCGNGLFTAAFSPHIAGVEAVDISPVLTGRLAARCLPNVRVSTSDMRDAQFAPQSFSKVLWYAGIQYIDETDIVAMVRRVRGWMKPGGILMIGDIPDRSKLWDYFNDDTRRAAYFDGLEQRKPIIGSWLDSCWIQWLCLASGFASAEPVPQHEELIYADFRYDLIARC